MTVSKEATIRAIISIREQIRNVEHTQWHGYTYDVRQAAIKSIPSLYETWRSLLVDLASIEEKVPPLNVEDIMILSTLMKQYEEHVRETGEFFTKSSDKFYKQVQRLSEMNSSFESYAQANERLITKILDKRLKRDEKDRWLVLLLISVVSIFTVVMHIALR